MTETDIHPEIRKFWEKIGKIENDATASAPVSLLVWVIYPDGDDVSSTTIYIASLPSNKNTITYHLGGERYSEEEMLRVLQLRCFL